MAIILYKPGSTHKIRGVPCEYKICEGHSLKQHLEDGWFITPEECYPEPILVPTYVEEEPVDAVREKAKEAGISNWYNKGVDKLKEELKTIKEL